MAGFYAEDWLEDLRARNDIVQVVSQYVPLTQKSRRYWGCCPFHSEKTPSFSVDPDKQFYYCFGCHAGGNVIHFIMNAEKLTFPEAVQFLAERAGIPLPDTANDEAFQKRRQQKERLYGALREAARYYHRMLHTDAGAQARAYLERRGMTQSQIVHFGLGYAPHGWQNLTDYLLQKGYRPHELVKAGLMVEKGDRRYDFFRDKVMFPIIDQRGRVVGFGGRMMQGDGPKYINTAETAVYNKREMLYGINFYRRFGHARELFVVEGYMDCITVSSFGFENVVASLGTALTTGQVRLIRRFADTVYICYDGDAAGRNATLRGLDLVEKEGLSVRVLMLPDGLDPDDFLRQRGAKAFAELKKQALTLTECKIEAVRAACDMQREDGRMAFAQRACALLAGASPVERERYMRRIAQISGFALETIERESQRAAQAPPERRTHPVKPPEQAQDAHPPKAETGVIAAMAQDEQALQRGLAVLEEQDFTHPVTIALFRAMQGMAHEACTPAGLLSHLTEPAQAAEAAALLSGNATTDPRAQAEMMGRLRVERLNREIDALLQLTRSAGAEQQKQAALAIQKRNETIRQIQQHGLYPLGRS